MFRLCILPCSGPYIHGPWLNILCLNRLLQTNNELIVWFNPLSPGVPNLWDLMPDDLRWNWKNNDRNKVHNKCSRLESSDSVIPMDCSPPGFSVHEIFQTRILEWVAISFSRGSSQPRVWTRISCIGRWIPKLLSHQKSPNGLLVFYLLICRSF